MLFEKDIALWKLIIKELFQSKGSGKTSERIEGFQLENWKLRKIKKMTEMVRKKSNKDPVVGGSTVHSRNRKDCVAKYRDQERK